MKCNRIELEQLMETIEGFRRQHEGDMQLIRTLVAQHEQDEQRINSLLNELELSRREAEGHAHTISEMAEELSKLKRMLFGTSSEKSHDHENNGSDAVINDQEEQGLQSDSKTKRESAPDDHAGEEGGSHQDPAPKSVKKRVRRNCPGKRDYTNVEVDDNNVVVLEPDSSLLKGARLMKTEEHWRIFYKPGTFYKVVYKRRIYSKDGMVISPKLPWVPEELRKRRCDPSLVAGILVNKYCHHIPLERQLRMFSDRFEIAKSTLHDYAKYGIDALEGLYQAIREKVLSGDRINVDETVQFIVDGDKHKTRNGYDWGFISPQFKLMYFKTDNGSRRSSVLDEEIKEYAGRFIQNDGYKVYENVAERTEKHLVQVFCMAHIRRKFWDCIEYHKDVSGQALYYINRMFMLERVCRKRKLKPDEVARKRSVYLKLYLDRFREWINRTLDTIKPSKESNIGRALNYALERIDSFYALCNNGLLELSNNIAERSMRGHTLGRKNYLFVQNGESAERTCKIYSIIESCKMCGIDPYKYIVEVLTRSPEVCMSYEELLPCNIKF